MHSTACRHAVSVRLFFLSVTFVHCIETSKHIGILQTFLAQTLLGYVTVRLPALRSQHLHCCTLRRHSSTWTCQKAKKQSIIHSDSLSALQVVSNMTQDNKLLYKTMKIKNWQTHCILLDPRTCVLPPVKFNSMISEKLPVYSESLMTTAVLLQPYFHIVVHKQTCLQSYKHR